MSWFAIIKAVNMPLLREVIDEILEEFNPTHFTSSSITERVKEKYQARLTPRERTQKAILTSIVPKILNNKGWVKSSFMEQRVDDLAIVRRGDVSDYYWFKVPEREEV